MHKRIVLVGKAASGKDYMRKQLEDKGFIYGHSYSTRPMREDEIDGEDYYFISETEFEIMKISDAFYEVAEFNGWFYGTTQEQFFNDDIFIMTPSGVCQIKAEDRKRTLVIYIDIDAKTRMERLLARNMPGDSVKRRIEADENDFKDFTDYDICISSPSF